MKVGVRVVGDGFVRADALVNDIRRRAIERLQARVVEERETERRRAASSSRRPDSVER